MWKWIGIGLAIILLGLGLTWIVQGNSFFMYSVFGVKYANVNQQIFEQSKSYNEGMVEELENMHAEYIKDTPEQQQALASIILHRAAAFNLNQPIVPQDLRDFIEQLQSKEFSK